MNLCETDICQRPTDICRVRPVDFELSGCGVPQAPQNARYVDLYRVHAYSVVLGALDSGTDILLDEKKTVDANADFILHRISCIGSDYFVRFQWPNGRYSSNRLQSVESFLGTITPNLIRVPAGDWIGIALQNFTEEAVNAVILFEGVNRFYLKGGTL